MLVLDVTDRPGELGGICRRIADAGVNIDLIYARATGRRPIAPRNCLETYMTQGRLSTKPSRLLRLKTLLRRSRGGEGQGSGS